MRMRGSVRVLLLCLVAGVGIILISWLLRDNDNLVMVQDSPRHPKMVTPFMQSFHAVAGDFDFNKDDTRREIFPAQNTWKPISDTFGEKNEVIPQPPLADKSNNQKFDQLTKSQNYFGQFGENVVKNMEVNIQQGVANNQNTERNNVWENNVNSDNVVKNSNTLNKNLNEHNFDNADSQHQLDTAENQVSWQNDRQIFQTAVTPEHRLVHLDLKGAPPKLAYLKEFFPLIRSLGATGILLEYEDMFPYSGILKKLSAKNCYSPKNITFINELAAANHLMVIPLIQTFGHLEFMLKLKEFKSLREVPKYPQSICPSHNQTFSILQTIINQVVKLHPNMKWLHIGCDEVYNLGECAECVSRMAHDNIDKNTLFIQHVMKVAEYIKAQYGIQPIVWDDMFRDMPLEILQQSRLSEYVQPMIWNYAQYVPEVLPFNTWDKYSNVFHNVWGASAFKGATGPFQYITNIRHHLDNHLSWLSIWNNEHSKFKKFYGFAITGWQRFDHFATLCELLPVGLPSLAINLLTLKYGFFNNDILIKASKALNYSNDYFINLDITSDITDEVPTCSFPGSNVFKGIKMYHSYRQSYDSSLKNSHLVGWMTAYNIKKNFSSPAHIEIGQKDYPRLIHNLTSLRTFMQKALFEVYDEYTIKEWIESFITPVISDLKRLLTLGKKLVNTDSWPRRPV